MMRWSWSMPACSPVPVDDSARLREENAALRIRLAAVEQAVRQLEQLYDRDVAILRAALLDTHEALVRDRESPEDGRCGHLVTQ